MERTACRIGNDGIIDKHSASLRLGQFLKVSVRRLPGVASRALEYCFGMYIGGLVGWLIGLYAGYLYVEYFEPVYLSDFSGVNEIMCWDRLRYVFAGAGAFAGAAIGAAAIFCFSLKTLNDKSGDNEANSRDQ